MTLYLDVGLVYEDGLNKLRPLAHNLAEDDGLLKEEYLELLKLFGGRFAQFRRAVELTVEEKFSLRRNLPLKKGAGVDANDK